MESDWTCWKLKSAGYSYITMIIEPFDESVHSEVLLLMERRIILLKINLIFKSYLDLPWNLEFNTMLFIMLISLEVAVPPALSDANTH